MLARVAGVIFPVFAVALVGWLYARWKQPDLTVTNELNMAVLSPALVFWALTDKPFSAGEFRDLTLGGFAVILGSGLLLLPIAPWLKVQRKTFLPPMMFNNSGNLGIPLALFAFGDAALQAAVLLFVVELLLHFTVGLYILDHRTPPWQWLKMPIVLALLGGLVCNLGGWPLPTPASNALHLLGEASIPLMLFALGARFHEVGFGDWRIGLWGALLCPLTGVAMALLVRPWLTLSPMQAGLLLLYGALPPAVMNYLVAERYDQEPEKVAALVLVGNLGSLIAIPAVLVFVLPG
ncbi:MAG: AEC family transporter [Candidatus Competibacteraceae bacterium]|nr:MAG: AEC family transporter [Candidatus Competibacteraceae bacterium]